MKGVSSCKESLAWVHFQLARDLRNARLQGLHLENLLYRSGVERERFEGVVQSQRRSHPRN